MQYIKAITLFLLHGKLFFAWLSRQVVTKSSSKNTPYLETIILFKSDQIGVCGFGKIIRHNVLFINCSLTLNALNNRP